MLMGGEMQRESRSGDGGEVVAVVNEKISRRPGSRPNMVKKPIKRGRACTNRTRARRDIQSFQWVCMACAQTGGPT